MPTPTKSKYEYVKKWRKENPQKHKALRATYNARHRDELNEKVKVWQRANRKRTAAYFQSWKKNNVESFTRFSLRKKTKLLGIELLYEDYMLLLEKQEGSCAICLQPETARHKSGSVCALSIDHDHTTGKVRGLLCKKCNTAMGFLGDKARTAFRAYKYLKRYE